MSKAPNKSPTVEREEWLRDALLPWAERHFTENPKDQSVILSVAQYWADEASDAVHAHAIASTRLIPRWPGPNWEDQDATAEDRSVSLWSSSEERLPWDSNGGAIRPFQALCGEIGSQEQAPGGQDQPVVMFQRTAAGLKQTWIGSVLRPWLDLPQTPPGGFEAEDENGDPIAVARPPPLPAQQLDASDVRCLETIANAPYDEGPRKVWADLWLQRSDPRGEFMAVPSRPIAEVLEQGEFWLGELNQVVPLSTAVFEFGSLAAATAYFDEETQALADSSWWLSVRELRFAAQGEQRLTPSMRGVRHLRGVNGQGLIALQQWAGAKKLISLEVDLGATAELFEDMRALKLERLEQLTLISPGALSTTPEQWSSLRQVTILEREAPSLDQVLSRVRSSISSVSVGCIGEGVLQEGWSLDFDRAAPSQAVLQLRRLGPLSSPERLEQLLEGLPTSVTQLRLAPSTVWLADDLELVRKSSKRPTLELNSARSTAR